MVVIGVVCVCSHFPNRHQCNSIFRQNCLEMPCSFWNTSTASVPCLTCKKTSQMASALVSHVTRCLDTFYMLAIHNVPYSWLPTYSNLNEELHVGGRPSWIRRPLACTFTIYRCKLLELSLK